MKDRHGPFPGCGLDRQIYHIECRLVTRKQLAMIDRFSDYAIQGFNCIGGVNHSTDLIRIIKQGDEMEPMGTPGPVDRRVFPVPAAGKIRQLLFAFCNGNSWMWVSGYTVVMAFGKPINPSTQAMKISRTTRLRNSVNTDNKNLDPSVSANHNPRSC